MKKVFWLALMAFSTLLVTGSATHPFYVSVSEIQHNAQSGRLEISMRMFVEDLELALEDRGHKGLYLGLEKESPEAESYVDQYIRRYLKIELNGEALEWTFLGKEMEGEAIWCYLESAEIDTPQKVKISNRLLFDTCEGQQNIVHLKTATRTKSLRLNEAIPEGTIEF
ncbi:MAG: DUF6702 family protein [Bacteroidota bacterium]